ncbi:hypothetical protein C7212DRAFT_348474 [Tuber magnatum]|uniref:Uncharacterized protein n=1 Tax=Tuber magnatum TaxID=42249 RepID=A0A317SDY0_9PEZI|nr:hypothetical protein C7212DRAFT_348474 [Tuber magnatum]
MSADATNTAAAPKDNTKRPAIRLGAPAAWINRITRSITETMGAFQTRFGRMVGYLNVVSNAVPEAGEPSNKETVKEGQKNAMKTLHARAPRRIPGGARHRSMFVAGPGRRKSVVHSTGQEGAGSAVASPVPKKTSPGGFRGQIAAKPVIKAESPVLKPRAGAGVTKRPLAEYLKDTLVAKANAEMEEDGLKEDQDVTTITTAATLVEAQVPAPLIPYPASLKLPNIKIHSMTPPIMPMEPVTPCKARKAPRTRPPHQAKPGPQRRSMRILESARKSERGKLAAGSTAQESGVPVEASLTTGKTVTRSQIAVRVAAKTMSPVLKPKAGAGVKKKTVAGALGRQIASKAKTRALAEKNIAATTVTATPTETPTGAPTPAPSSVHNNSPEHSEIATNAAPATIMHTNSATTDKVTSAPRTKAPHKEPQAPQRRSMRIIESAQKSAQDKLAVDTATQEGRGPVSPMLVTKTGTGGSRSRIRTEDKAKVNVENEKEESIEPVTRVRPLQC